MATCHDEEVFSTAPSSLRASFSMNYSIVNNNALDSELWPLRNLARNFETKAAYSSFWYKYVSSCPKETFMSKKPSLHTSLFFQLPRLTVYGRRGLLIFDHCKNSGYIGNAYTTKAHYSGIRDKPRLGDFERQTDADSGEPRPFPTGWLHSNPTPPSKITCAC